MQRHGVRPRVTACAPPAADALSAIRSGEFGDALVVRPMASQPEKRRRRRARSGHGGRRGRDGRQSFGEAGSRVVLEKY
jgi:hypothetical protein